MQKLVKKLSDNGPAKMEPSTIDVAEREQLRELWSKIQDIIYCPVISTWQHALLEEFVRLTTVLELSDAEGTNEILNFCRRADAVRLVEYAANWMDPDFPEQAECWTTELIELVTTLDANPNETADKVRRLLVKRAEALKPVLKPRRRRLDEPRYYERDFVKVESNPV